MILYVAVGVLCLVTLTSAGTINPAKIEEFSSGKSSEIFEIIPIQADLTPEGKWRTTGEKEQYPNLQEILKRYLKSNKVLDEKKYGEENPETQDQKYERILKEVSEAKPEEQRYDEQNPEPQKEEEDDIKNNEEELKREEQKYEKQEAQNQEYNKILKQIAEAKSEEQRYDEQNPEPQEQEYDRLLKEAAQVKHEGQKFEYENAEPQDEEEDDNKFNDDPKHKIEFDAISNVFQQTRNGPSRAEITEIKPSKEMLKIMKVDQTQRITTDKPGDEGKNKPQPKFLVPEAPSFSTRLSVPPLPISLSSIRSMMLKWPHELPSIFKAPKIIYLGHH